MLALGDSKWIAKAAQHSKVSVPCPDCFGKKFLTVTLGDDSQVTIDCSTCASGFESPRGYVLIDHYEPDAERVTIRSIELESIDNQPVYSGETFYRLLESELFEHYSEALARAVIKARLLAVEAEARFQRKEKDTHTWAWNVTYHRRSLKEAQRQLDYHTAKLAVSLPHKKDEAPKVAK
jgi:hypothetical protein